MAEPRFRHEDVAAVPKGWKVSTVKHDDHRVRVAFPPGRRIKGSGRLVSVLHPKGENPCALKSSNPQELLIMSANPPRRRNPSGYRVVAFPKYGTENFTSATYQTKGEAQKVAKTVDRKRYFHPRIQRVPINPNPPLASPGAAATPLAPPPAPNPPAAEIYERFTGNESTRYRVATEPHIPAGDYAQLGKLLSLFIKPIAGGQVKEIAFPPGSQPAIVSDESARQMYFVGGDQDISDRLQEFGASAASETVELGEGRRIDYQGRKDHVDHPEYDQWKHDFGEENGILPTVRFDTRYKRLLLAGGDYRVDGAWLRN